MTGLEKYSQKQVKEPRSVNRGSLNLPPSRKCLGGTPLTILLFLLIVLSRILPAGINIPLLLLASLTGLSGLSGLLTLAVLALVLLTLSLAVLATLLLVLFHIVCHSCSSVFTERVLARRRGIIVGTCCAYSYLVAICPRRGWELYFCAPVRIFEVPSETT
jgi:hypothetical protein